MKEYNEYKNIHQRWIKKIPAHWKVLRLKLIFELRKEPNNPIITNNILSLTAKQGVIPYEQKKGVGGNRPKSDLTKYNICRKGDLLVNNMNIVSGAAGVSKYTGAVSPVYYPLVIRENSNVWYYHYIFRLITFQRSLIGLGKGILMHESDNGTLTSVRMRISMDSLGNVLLPVPPRAEQDQIVRFLDWKISEINKLIGIRKKEIQELRILKNTIIDRSIIRGIDENINYKRNQNYYLPIVPEHWSLMKLKRICKLGASIKEQLKKYNEDDVVVFLPMEKITTMGEFDCSIKVPIKQVKSGFTSFARDDVIVAKITPCFENGKGASLEKLETEIGYGTTELFNLRPNNKVLSKYLYYITMTKLFRGLGEGRMTGAAGQKRVPAEFIKNFLIGVPSIQEQCRILTYIHKRFKEIDELIQIRIKQCQELLEYKTVVISDVVTGKIDVRKTPIPNYEFVDDTDISDDTESELEERCE
ncbi:restriction endonuclease subunit S [Megasphaera sp.]|uniref:restriction endonuclease subunit S n=1 Tax=Megasphaera sp. TaxID=2023260 RepID=UPI00258F6CD3|nr:restriction endonuclease subunit S [Megasphaera sp.]